MCFGVGLLGHLLGLSNIENTLNRVVAKRTILLKIWFKKGGCTTGRADLFIGIRP